jgi:hypothetical protein
MWETRPPEIYVMGLAVHSYNVDLKIDWECQLLNSQKCDVGESVRSEPASICWINYDWKSCTECSHHESEITT